MKHDKVICCMFSFTYHWTKISEIFETGTNGMKKLLNFRKAIHSTENFGNTGMKVKWNGNF